MRQKFGTRWNLKELAETIADTYKNHDSFSILFHCSSKGHTFGLRRTYVTTMSTIELRGSSFNHSSTAFWVALWDGTESGVHTDPIYTWDEGVSARSHVFEPGDSLRQLQVKYVYALCHFSSCSSTPFAIVPRLFVIIAGIKQFKTAG